MADLTITAANVQNVDRTANPPNPGRLATNEGAYLAGADITAGDSLYLDTSASPNSAKLANSDDTAATATALAIALCDAASGQVVIVQTGGNIDLGATLTVGETYVVSNNAGGIAPISDLGPGDYVSILGTASAADKLVLAIRNTGITKA